MDMSELRSKRGLIFGRVCGHCRAALPEEVYHGISKEDAQARLIAEASAEAAGIDVWGQPNTAQRTQQAITPSPAIRQVQGDTSPVRQGGWGDSSPEQQAAWANTRLSQATMREARVNAARVRESGRISPM